ncbi:MAG: hypothetical protein K6A31_01120 [Fibrobacter sp.]|nr:hypothetical protein [Fibrobacter sp.]
MTIDKYFDSIKHNKAKLRQFIADMPKGAELHHHLTGAVYAETLFAIAYNQELYVNPDTGRLSVDAPDPKKYPDADKYIQLTAKTFEPDENGYKKYDFHFTRISLIDKWSVRDYQPYKYPLGPDEYFFSLFGNFIAAAGNKYLPTIVHRLKVRAKEENLQYIETIGIAPSIPKNAFLEQVDYDGYNEEFNLACLNFYKNPENYTNVICNLVYKILKIYEQQYESKTSLIYNAVKQYVLDNQNILSVDKPDDNKQDAIAGKFDTTSVSDSDVVIRLQGYASRGGEPVDVLAQLYIVHRAMCLAPDLIVGCNLVAAENSENSMLYYKAHMMMLAILRNVFKNKTGKDYPNVALHAGELTMGLVPPEQLTYHITDAVKIAHAKRIGHGVDIVFEHDSAELLEYMKQNNIAIEINLTSNEFILGVKGDSHPFSIYKDSGVPMVISTDDPGILRTSITEEYALAAYRYDLTYGDIRELVYNSITYSFLDDDGKAMVKKMVDAKFSEFETKYAN